MDDWYQSDSFLLGAGTVSADSRPASLEEIQTLFDTGPLKPLRMSHASNDTDTFRLPEKSAWELCADFPARNNSAMIVRNNHCIELFKELPERFGHSHEHFFVECECQTDLDILELLHQRSMPFVYENTLGAPT